FRGSHRRHAGGAERRQRRGAGRRHHAEFLPVVLQGETPPMSLQVRILGCGSSGGVPRLGGADGSGYWGACDPADPRNRRLRCSLLARRITADGATQVLIDTSPDLREQLLAARVTDLDAV